jgi:carboxyl-terminal processing protease
MNGVAMSRFVKWIIVLSFFLSIFPISAKDIKPDQDMEKIARIAAAITVRQHYRQKPLDDEVSRLLFDEYFKTLDPGKIYFTTEDIASFNAYRDRLDDQLSFGQVSFAFEVYNLFQRRVEEYYAFLKEAVAKGFSFSGDETYLVNRTKESWPANREEQRELWQKRIKNDILTARLIDRAAKMEKEKGKDKETAAKEPVQAHDSWSKTPDEKVVRRMDNYLHHLGENDAISVLELYLSSLQRVYDPHSAYMSPNSEEDFNISMKLSLVGIGAVLSSDDGYTKIVKLIPGGPAERDGRLKPEDRIIAVAQENGNPVDIIDMPLNKVVKMIRGPAGTRVSLTILEGTKGINAIPKEIVILREEVKLKEQEAKGEIRTIRDAQEKERKIGIITLPSFYIDFAAAQNQQDDYKSSTRDVAKILETFNREGIDGLIFDIRSNGGGSLVEAIQLTGLFIETGPVVQIRDQRGLIDKKHDTDKEILFTKPMIVITNRFSASASEIFAGAIQDYGRGIVVGDDHTHGKGTVQTIFELGPYLNFFGFDKPAGSLKLTTAKFYRISGGSNQEKGIVPDLTFPSFSEAMEIGEKHLDHVLAWDSIPPDNFKKWNNGQLNAIIPVLRENSETRLQNDEDFQRLCKDIVRFKALRDRQEVSLNEEIRWEEYLGEKKIIEEQSTLMKLDADTEEDADSPASEKRKQSDLYLDETLRIMADYLALLKRGNPPEKEPVAVSADNP